MIIVKFIVLICCVNCFSASTSDWCEICLNHTLCKYKTQGPSQSCKSYDSTALLTSRAVTELVDRINERRNFVAMGYSKILPQAADMKKIRWSTELATFAQRWADQCDPSVRPDKEDQCRDLENIKVGQNIGSVLGPSPGLNMKGFVEMWFIQVLDFAGSVTYYNKSQDFKTDYFTQLIWADTEFVGCGKSKFYVDERNLMVERLVCNFAPKGNIHGKPVYAIGFPGTQCKHRMMPDVKYKGLCAYQDYEMRNIPFIIISHYVIPFPAVDIPKPITQLTTQSRPVNSLLRILNLSNDSVKHDIDPIRNNLKQTNVSSNSHIGQRNQKTRHILPNKTNAVVKRISPLRKQLIGKIPVNISGNGNEYHYQHDRGHSHLYHGHEPPRYNYEITTAMNTNLDYRRYDYTTELINSYSDNNFRKYNQIPQCTRRMTPIQNNYASNQCSTEHDIFCQQTTICPSTCTEHTCSPPYIPPLPEPCTCTKPTCPPIITNCNYETTCQCSSTHKQCYTTLCPGRQNNEFNDYRRTGTFQYYDSIPNVVVRSGNNAPPAENSPKDLSFFDNSDTDKSYKTIHDIKDPHQIHKDITNYPKYKTHDGDYLYRAFDSSLRKRRQLDDQTVKPFWQIDSVNYKIPSQLKSMKFTTLAGKKNRKTRRNMESVKWLASTEPITLKFADYAEYQPEHATEKYLSFDELMHLRKINDGYAQYDFRRQDKKTTAKGTKAASKPKNSTTIAAKTTKKAAEEGKTSPPKEKVEPKDKKTESTEKTTTTKATTTTATTTEYTANTPYERKKHCTRKLTCSWTAYTSDESGNTRFVGNEIGGSRTPPGYVEGCTRTSTCTRDYMDRNKVSTLSDSDEWGEGGVDDERGDGDDKSEGDSRVSSSGDEDYCERRSLNVQRRNSDDNKPSALRLRSLSHTDFSKTITNINSDLAFDTYTESVTISISTTHECICNTKLSRNKRQGTEHARDSEDQYDDSKFSFSYGDLYYLILSKILKSNQANKYYTHQCPCNGSLSFSPSMFLFSFSMLVHLNIILRFLNNTVKMFHK